MFWTARPTSWNAWRFGLPVLSKFSFATETISTGAARAHRWFPSTRQLSRCACSSGFCLVATIKFHGCSLNDEAAQRAASKRLRNFSGSTRRSENARGLQRRLRISAIGYWVSAGFSIFVLPTGARIENATEAQRHRDTGNVRNYKPIPTSAATFVRCLFQSLRPLRLSGKLFRKEISRQSCESRRSRGITYRQSSRG